MALWIILVIVGQFLNAIAALIDKFIVTSKSVVLQPYSYAFVVSLMSALSVIIFLFSWIPIPIEGIAVPSIGEVSMPSIKGLALALLAGYAFLAALYMLFSAVSKVDASDAVPVVGGVNALVTLILSFIFLSVEPHPYFIVGFIFLVVGTLFVSHFRFDRRTALYTILAGISFAVYYIAIKFVFFEMNFDSGFIWTRFAIAFAALSTLVIPWCRHHVISHTKSARRKDGALVIGNKILAGLASIILLKAVELGDVSLVQALGGIQYVFLLGFSVLFGHLAHQDFGENNSKTDIIHKLISIPLIVIGFFLLFFN